MKIFCIPGLGYDHRIYSRLDFSGLDVNYLNWIEPFHNESISGYAQRLFSDLPDAGEEIVLIGHSFGGIVSQEIARFKKIQKIILISSIKSRDELPFFFRMISPLKIHYFFSKEVSIKTVRYWGKDHGFTLPEDLELFKSMVGNMSDHYLRWALKSLSRWQPEDLPSHTKLFQIHGTNDLTFPIKLINHPDVAIKDGSHIMLYKEAQKIIDILRKELSA